ncbi:MAG TPA: hypothetical protein ENO22_00010 [candidate division Zixibacteria bacterium]|nr:hypothetical protein [candidate division Zixibacteria bacterium]HEQ97710.1 hypothetical protein [candidate division Zixibacteria bacterium]
MHPSRFEIEMYLAGRLDDDKKRAEIAEHLKLCEFCSEIAEEFREYLELLYEEDPEIPLRAYRQAELLANQALEGTIIPLKPIESACDEEIAYLAADGPEGELPEIVNLVTFYSDDPELVLKVMRNNREKRDYLELIGDEPFQVANVMIRIPEIEHDLITDTNGIASLADLKNSQYEQFSWQIKMPDAVFHLEPLEYDPDKTEYSKEMELETDHGDKIRIRFEGKTEGKQISVTIMQLEGESDFGGLKVLISQENLRLIKSISETGDVVFDLADKKAGIDIRLFK